MGALASGLPTAGKPLFIAIAIAFLSVPGCGAKSPPDDSSASLRLASDYVLAACLIQKYAGSALAEEAEIWAQGLVEQGNLPADAYPKLAGLVSLAPEVGQSSTGKMMLMRSCVDLYNSPDAKAQIRQIVAAR